MIRVMIADDHKVLIDGMKSMLQNQEEILIVAEALDGNQVIKELEVTDVDVILLDINMPHLDGIETCKVVKKKYPEIKVLALTMYNEGSFIQNMIKSGASGYLLKNSGKEEVINAIKTVHSDGTYFSSEVSETLMKSMMPGNTKLRVSEFIPKLTRREKEILALIVKEHTTAEIAKQLFVSLSTVETHRKNLLSKLGVRNTAGLVRVTLEKGLLS